MAVAVKPTASSLTSFVEDAQYDSLYTYIYIHICNQKVLGLEKVSLQVGTTGNRILQETVFAVMVLTKAEKLTINLQKDTSSRAS